MKAIFIKNYQEGNRVFLKGQELEVTPWFYRKLQAGGFIKVPKIETATIDNKKFEKS